MANVIITRNRPYELLVDIKQPNSPTGATLPYDAAAKFYIVEKGIKGKAIIISEMTRVMPVTIPPVPPTVNADPPVDTIFKLTLTGAETALLPFELGYMEDGEPFHATCRGQITIDSPSSPDVQFADTFIQDIYIADLGI